MGAATDSHCQRCPVRIGCTRVLARRIAHSLADYPLRLHAIGQGRPTGDSGVTNDRWPVSGGDSTRRCLTDSQVLKIISSDSLLLIQSKGKTDPLQEAASSIESIVSKFKTKVGRYRVGPVFL